MNDLRGMPSVDQLLQTQKAVSLVATYGRPQTLEAIRSVLADLRDCVRENKVVNLPDQQILLEQAQDKLNEWFKPTLVPVINASGVILHTNLGRAPLSTSAVQAIQATALGYSNLEYDLTRGKRSTRAVHVEEILKRLTGTEAALVVNNNASALLLILAALAKRKRVVIARSQLVEVGGGFRIPDVMLQSGAKLVEVGTTNRVHPEDYAQALEDPTGFVLHAHHSNFKIVGFTTEVALADLVQLAHAKGTPVLDDLGSGAFLDTAAYGLAHEPTVQESLAAGVDLVCFSGDKLLGGPQAGIILGRTELLDKIKKHPLARAVRADKLCLAALAATLVHYLKSEAENEIPVWQMISASIQDLEARAERWRNVLGMGEVIDGNSTVGGGSLPEETLPTKVLALRQTHPDQFLSKLRRANPPIVARIQDGRIVLDPRTVLPEQEEALLVGLKKTLGLI
jgi:L-seryl-tRNA(Ser) seleniumtransferase